MSSTSTRAVLEELHLLRCSLLPGELLSFTEDSSIGGTLLDVYATDPDAAVEPDDAQRAIRLDLRAEDSDVWFEVELPPGYREGRIMPSVAVKGNNLGRTEQERWQAAVAEALEEVRGSEYPLYELISTHLLPRLHQESEARRTADIVRSDNEAEGPPVHRPSAQEVSPSPRYHALFTSHHLKSPQKRRSLAQWAHELSLSGFAKVGYPGVIYCEGTQEDVEDFVARVKSMQWLALRLRFIEPIPHTGGHISREWVEFEKVGEVVEEMRRRGRESYVVEMGIGSAGTPSK